jgi:hypothetical protein
MPGGIFTGLQRHWDPEVLADMKAQHGEASKTPEQGAATSVLLATSPDLAGIGGRYYEECQQAEVVDQIRDGIHGVRPYALDPIASERLWDVSLDLLTAARATEANFPSARPGATRWPQGRRLHGREYPAASHLHTRGTSAPA